MFQSVLYRNTPGPGPLIDIGSLAEGLLFYNRVSVVGNTGTLKHLLETIPPFVLLSLMKTERLSIHYLGEQTGVRSQAHLDGQTRHSLIRFSSPNHTIEQVAAQAFYAAAGSTSQAKLSSRKFADLLKPIDYTGFDQASILRALADCRAVEESVQGVLRLVAADYRPVEPINFRVELLSDSEFRVETNLDFSSVNESYHRLVPASHSSINEAYLLAKIQAAYESTFFAAVLDSEVSVPPIERAVHAATVSALVARCARSEDQIDRFQNLTLQNANAIREAINSGKVPFADLVRVLDKADKFRDWLQKQPQDEDVVQAFYRETVRDTWIEKAPGKSVRWLVFTGIGLAVDSALGTGGLIATAAGASVGAVDTFVAERLLRGWKPHMFVEQDLRPLLQATPQ